MHRSRTLPFLLALASLALPHTSQEVASFAPVEGPLRTATLRVATGTLEVGPPEKAAGLTPVFVNTDTSGFHGVGPVATSAGNPIEWLDWGTVPNDSGSDVVGSFTFGYGTSVTGPQGASALLRFYEGISGFCADSGAVPTASFHFTGLPAGTSPGTASGWLITVDLAGGFEFLHPGTETPFGFGFTTIDDEDGDGNRETGPLLCYAGPSTSVPDPNGQVDVFDEWELGPATGNCLGSFFFGGAPFNFSSWYLVLEAADASAGPQASATTRNGSGVNPSTFQATLPPVLGERFVGFEQQAAGGIGSLVYGYRDSTQVPTPFGELLVDPASPGGELLGSAVGPYLFDPLGFAPIAIDVPADLELCGLVLSIQAVEFGGGAQLKNALDLVVGF